MTILQITDQPGSARRYQQQGDLGRDRLGRLGVTLFTCLNFHSQVTPPFHLSSFDFITNSNSMSWTIRQMLRYCSDDSILVLDDDEYPSDDFIEEVKREKEIFYHVILSPLARYYRPNMLKWCGGATFMFQYPCHNSLPFPKVSKIAKNVVLHDPRESLQLRYRWRDSYYNNDDDRIKRQEDLFFIRLRNTFNRV